jgi:hypothetical protein
MQWLLLLLLFCAEGQDRLEFSSFRMRDDPQKQLFVHAYGYTADLMRMTLLVRFSASFFPQPLQPLQQHNALLIDAYNAAKYRHIMKTSDANDDRDDHLDFNNKITIVTRAQQKRLSYHLYDPAQQPLDTNGDGVAGGDGDSNQTDLELELGEGGDTGTSNSASDAYLYDLIQSAQLVNLQNMNIQHSAVLMLDRQSSVWQHYNRFTVARHVLTLEYTEETEPVPAVTARLYNSAVRLSCDPSYSVQFCLVRLATPQLEVNAVASEQYRLVVDLDAYINFLPADLYVRWLQEKRLQLRWLDPVQAQYSQAEASAVQTLILDSRFDFKLHDSDDIVLGADLMHLLPRLSYTLVDHTLTLWSYQAQQHETVEAVQIFYILVDLILIYCFFHWATSSNYYVLYFIMRFDRVARRLHLFAYRQITCELVVMTLSVLLWILSLAISVRGSVNPFDPSHMTLLEKRTVLTVLYGLYYFLLNLYILLMTPEVFQALVRYYWRSTHPQKPSAATTTTTTTPTASVLRAGSILLSGLVGGVKKRHRRAEDYQLKASVTTTEPLSKPKDWDETDNETLALLQEASDDAEERQALYIVFVENYQTALIRGSTALTIVRNVVLSQLILCGLILITNSYTESNIILLLLTMALALYALYYQIKFTTTGIFLLQMLYESDTRRERGFFTFFVVVQIAVIATQMALGFEVLFLPALRAINSQYTETVLHIYVTLLLVLVTLASVYMVVREQSLLIQERLQEARQQRDEQRTAYYVAATGGGTGRLDTV